MKEEYKIKIAAGVAQQVEHNVANVVVEGSTPFTRFFVCLISAHLSPSNYPGPSSGAKESSLRWQPFMVNFLVLKPASEEMRLSSREEIDRDCSA